MGFFDGKFRKFLIFGIASIVPVALLSLKFAPSVIGVTIFEIKAINFGYKHDDTPALPTDRSVSQPVLPTGTQASAKDRDPNLYLIYRI
jgi:hypothetical protein